MTTGLEAGLFGVLRVFGVLTAVVGVVLLVADGTAMAWPWLRASLYCLAPVAAPQIFVWLFDRKRERRS